MQILMTGGTGLIGRALTHFFTLRGDNVSILTRQLPVSPAKDSQVNYLTDLSHLNHPVDVIINLAGEPLNRHRWNQAVKERIANSRIQTTHTIVEYIKRAPQKPSLLISGSAIGYYGASLDAHFTEASAAADNGYTHRLCDEWEKTAMTVAPLGVRVCCIRTGIVLDPQGGALKEMLLPFKLGLGAQLGDGQQWMSWIHRDDVVRAIAHIIDTPTLMGPINLTAPFPVTHAQFTRDLAHTLKRWSVLRLPKPVVKCLFGEMGERLLLEGQHVLPAKLVDSGFVFAHPQLPEALSALLIRT